MRTLRGLLIFVAANCLLAIGSLTPILAQASVIVGSPSAVEGIDGLMFTYNGVSYDWNVSFLQSSQPVNFAIADATCCSTYGDGLFSELLSETVGKAIANALGAASATGIAGLTPETSVSETFEYIFVPWQYPAAGDPNLANGQLAILGGQINEGVVTNYFYNSVGSGILALNGDAVGNAADLGAGPSVAYADFSPVPDPPTVWLLLTGLGILAGFVRLRRGGSLGH